jgi:uncharacterized membrane-anchored protein
VAWLLVVSVVIVGGTITVAIFLVVGVRGSIVSFFLSVGLVGTFIGIWAISHGEGCESDEN